MKEGVVCVLLSLTAPGRVAPMVTSLLQMSAWYVFSTLVFTLGPRPNERWGEGK